MNSDCGCLQQWMILVNQDLNYWNPKDLHKLEFLLMIVLLMKQSLTLNFLGLNLNVSIYLM